MNIHFLCFDHCPRQRGLCLDSWECSYASSEMSTGCWPIFIALDLLLHTRFCSSIMWFIQIFRKNMMKLMIKQVILQHWFKVESRRCRPISHITIDRDWFSGFSGSGEPCAAVNLLIFLNPSAEPVCSVLSCSLEAWRAAVSLSSGVLWQTHKGKRKQVALHYY